MDEWLTSTEKLSGYRAVYRILTKLGALALTRKDFEENGTGKGK